MNSKPLTKNEVIKLLNNFMNINLETEFINLLEAEHRILAEPITSLIDLPPFNNSAVDGYALYDDDVGKTEILKISCRIAAGDDKKIVLNNRRDPVPRKRTNTILLLLGQSGFKNDIKPVESDIFS